VTFGGFGTGVFYTKRIPYKLAPRHVGRYWRFAVFLAIARAVLLLVGHVIS